MFFPSFQRWSSCCFPSSQPQAGQRSLAGQAAKTQHRLLKDLHFNFFLLSPREILFPLVSAPFCPLLLLPLLCQEQSPLQHRLQGKALPFEVA